MRVLCKTHHQLYVYDLNVRFASGVADVDEKTAKKLRGMKGFNFEFPQQMEGDVDAGTGKAPAGDNGQQPG